VWFAIVLVSLQIDAHILWHQFGDLKVIHYDGHNFGNLNI
jgi:hypothetical protein